MKGSLIRQRFGSILVMLVLVQQVGAGLYIHNLCHKETPVKNTFKENPRISEIMVGCSCVDNFFTPFIEAGTTSITPPIIIHQHPVDTYTDQLIFADLILSSLRGPPLA